MTQRCKGLGTDGFARGSERVGTGSADPHGRWGLCADIMRASPLAAAGRTRLTLTAGVQPGFDGLTMLRIETREACIVFLCDCGGCESPVVTLRRDRNAGLRIESQHHGKKHTNLLAPDDWVVLR